MHIINGWLTNAYKAPSPNYNARPAGVEISLLVVHNISLPPGQFGTGCVTEFFQNRLDYTQHPFFKEIEGLEVSAHCLIERNGSCTQYVSFYDRAWHAGRSCFDGVEECNDYSIGVELEGTDDTAYTEAQYLTLSKLARVLMLEFPAIDLSRVAGHCDIAPGRKTDPGLAFDWQKLRQLVAG